MIGETVFAQMLFEALAIDGIGFEGIDLASRCGPFGGEEGEIAEIGADVDEPGAGFEQSMDEARSVQLVETDGHGDVGIGTKIELETQAVWGLESSGAIFFRDKCA